MEEGEEEIRRREEYSLSKMPSDNGENCEVGEGERGEGEPSIYSRHPQKITQ